MLVQLLPFPTNVQLPEQEGLGHICPEFAVAWFAVPLQWQGTVVPLIGQLQLPAEAPLLVAVQLDL